MDRVHHRSPVLASVVLGMSTPRLVGTPDVGSDGSHGTRDVVTPVTQAALDPLMHTALQTPPLSITPTGIGTPPEECCCHISGHVFVTLFGDL
jgi:hypothetical protein